jgi:hypothetical protein
MWLKVGAVIAVIAVIGAGAWLLVGRDALARAACAGPQPTEVEAAPVVFEPTISWQSAELPDVATGPDQQVMLAVTSRDHGWVATGNSSDGPTSHGFVLSTTDGSAWLSDPTDAVQFDETEIRLLVEVDRRVVAAGSIWTGDVRTGTWVNRGGTSWQAGNGAFDRSAPTALGARVGSLLMLGRADPSGHPLAWASATGAEWAPIDLRLPVDPALATFASVRPDGEGWIAVGSLSRGVDTPAWPVVWASSDGATWTCRLLDSAGFGVAQPMELHRSAQGWLAVGIAGAVCGFGASCAGSTIAWTSPDGLGWSAARTGDQPWHTGGIVVAGSAEGFVAVGHATTWWSADGNAWVEVKDGGTGAALVGQPDALHMTDDGRLAAVGTSDGAGGADAWIATGFLVR